MWFPRASWAILLLGNHISANQPWNNAAELRVGCATPAARRKERAGRSERFRGHVFGLTVGQHPHRLWCRGFYMVGNDLTVLPFEVHSETATGA